MKFTIYTLHLSAALFCSNVKGKNIVFHKTKQLEIQAQVQKWKVKHYTQIITDFQLKKPLLSPIFIRLKLTDYLDPIQQKTVRGKNETPSA